MNAIRIRSMLLLMLSVLWVSSCKDLDEMNENPNGVNPNTTNPSLVLSTVLTQTGWLFTNLSHWEIMSGLMQHTQKDGWVGAYNEYDWGMDNSWAPYYDILRNNQYVFERAGELSYKAHQGIALVMKSMVFGMITDLWGDAPYTNALKAEKGGGENLFPQFDSQETIYTGILADLEEANRLLSGNASDYPPVGNADVFYGGNVGKWRKLANSLALRYYMRISSKKPDVARAGIEKIAGNPTEYPVITSAADDAAMDFAGTNAANSWPANTTFDPSESNFRRIKMCATLVEYMQASGDPRLGVWAAKVQIPLVVDPKLPAGTDKIENGKRYLSPDKVAGREINTDPEYVGLPVALLGGAAYNMSPTAEQGARNPHVSWLNDAYRAAKGPLLKARLMSASEVHFILAEASLKGWNTGDAAVHYNEAIKASLTTWGLAAQAEVFLRHPAVVFNNTLKQIIEQKWVASWTAAQEAWFDYRRTGYPELKAGPQAKRTALPLRLYYMLDERNLNQANVDAALERLEQTAHVGADGKNSAWAKPWVLQGTGKPW